MDTLRKHGAKASLQLALAAIKIDLSFGSI